MKLTILGSGKMGEALARGILNAGLISPRELTLADINSSRLASLSAELGTAGTGDNVEAAQSADVVILAVKPNLVESVCKEIAGALPECAVLLSIAAGVTLESISRALSRSDLFLVRAMPNTPCLVGAGTIGISFRENTPASVPADKRRLIIDLLSPLGIVEEFPEAQLNAVTGLSGSGPAYVALMIEALADGGVLMGLPRDVALKFAAQTVFGTAKMVLETKQHPVEIKEAVSSPGGTTIAGIMALEEGGFRAAVIDAVRRAAARAKELSGA